MTDDFAALYAFNRWANDLMLDACRQLSPEQYGAEPTPGWSPVRTTVYHIAVATDGWLRGVADDLDQSWPTEDDAATPVGAAAILARAYQTFDTLLPRLTPEFLATPKTFRRGERVAVLPPWVALRHVVNHATYHRGQVASKLKQFGVRQAETDLIYWAFQQTEPAS
ncbi:MAG: DinB family protein [Planctomycetales bacterium]|nr:DinB family protein [Planctomycetales bacterium]